MEFLLEKTFPVLYVTWANGVHVVMKNYSWDGLIAAGGGIM